MRQNPMDLNEPQPSRNWRMNLVTLIEFDASSQSGTVSRCRSSICSKQRSNSIQSLNDDQHSIEQVYKVNELSPAGQRAFLPWRPCTSTARADRFARSLPCSAQSRQRSAANALSHAADRPRPRLAVPPPRAFRQLPRPHWGGGRARPAAKCRRRREAR